MRLSHGKESRCTFPNGSDTVYEERIFFRGETDGITRNNGKQLSSTLVKKREQPQEEVHFLRHFCVYLEQKGQEDNNNVDYRPFIVP